nr:MAG TPA: minor capsid protein [Caudoviricetes sp.]
MIRNMDRHRAEEIEEGYNWSMWQVEQLKALEKYKRNNRKKYGKQFRSINAQIGELIRMAREEGNMQQEIVILKNIRRGYRFPGVPARVYDLMEEMDGRPLREKAALLREYITGKKNIQGTAEFFKLNDRKLEALIQATMQDMEKAETAILRKADDDYRKAIFNAQVYANTGAGTYEKAVDMATKDMLSRGLNCVEYANGARHTLSDYADMAIRTASKRAYLQGEGEKRQEWGVHTVIMNKRGNPCPKCLPFVGKVLIDDVWSGGSRKDGKYPLMSYAISQGLYHPRCKDSHTTYFPGISTADDTWTQKELEAIGLRSKQEARQQYAARQEEKFSRLAEYLLDPGNKAAYGRKAAEWKKQSEIKPLTLEEEGAIIRYVSPEAYVLNDKLRRNATSELTSIEKDWLKNLDAALENLPNYEGNLNRSVTFLFEEDAQKYFDGFIVGKEYIPRQYLSTTKNGVYNDDAQVQIYIQNTKKGKDLGRLNDMENEVLYPFMARFKVLNKVKQGNKFYILLEELE